MSHEFDTGFAVRQPMWHGLGNILDDYPGTWDEARRLAEIEWDVVEAPVYSARWLPAGRPAPTGSVPMGQSSLIGPGLDPVERFMVPVDGRKVIERSDTGAALGVPTTQFSPITNAMHGELVEAVLEQGSTVKYETLLSLRGGAEIVALVRLDEPVTIDGDTSPTLPYLAVVNRHDGTGACRALLTAIRIVCMNTNRAAQEQADRDGLAVSIRHTGDVAERVEQAKAMLAYAREAHAAWVAEANYLATFGVSDEVLADFLDDFIPIPDGATARVRDGRVARRAEFMGIWTSSPTAADLPDTAYKLTQVAVEYLDHYRTARTPETYLRRTMIQTDPTKGRVARVVKELVGA